MPELPEVETIARGLRELLSGRRIMDVSVPGRHLAPGGDKPFRAKLENRIFLGVQVSRDMNFYEVRGRDFYESEAFGSSFV